MKWIYTEKKAQFSFSNKKNWFSFTIKFKKNDHGINIIINNLYIVSFFLTVYWTKSYLNELYIYRIYVRWQFLCTLFTYDTHIRIYVRLYSSLYACRTINFKNVCKSCQEDCIFCSSSNWTSTLAMHTNRTKWMGLASFFFFT